MNADITENHLLKETHARQRAMLLEKFPALSGCPHQHFLSLRMYLYDIPQRFFSHEIFEEMFKWLQHRDSINRNSLQQILNNHLHELNRAFLHIEEINAYTWHDHFKKTDDHELTRFIDQKINPSYLRLTEGVLEPLLKTVAYFSRQDRGKKPEGLNIWNIVEEVLRTDICQAVSPYKHNVRNGIAHGGITYFETEINYQDDHGNEERLSNSNIIRLFDDLVDSCNALTLALSLFLHTHQEHGYSLPQNMVLNELKAETRAPWWQITGCTPSKFSNLNQLNIYARPKTYDYNKVQLATFQSGVIAEQCAPGYDRYFFSIRSHNSLPGWAAFNGKKLRKLRTKSNTTLENYKDVLEDNLVFYIPPVKLPRIFHKTHTLLTSLRIQWPLCLSDFRRQMGWHSVIVRETTIHRNSWGCVLNGSVIFHPINGDITQDAVRKSCRLIVRQCLSTARRKIHLTKPVRYLPLGFAHIAIFQKDYRQRRLKSFGLDKDLICTIQVQYIQRIRRPDILGSTIEQKGRYRIAWNKSWMESQSLDNCAKPKVSTYNNLRKHVNMTETT